jgi:hypothetical protein
MSEHYAKLLALLVAEADRNHDGHLTIMKFTTNWRVSFGTPEQVMDEEVLFEGKDGPAYPEVEAMPVGKTFKEAAKAALTRRFVDDQD